MLCALFAEVLGRRAGRHRRQFLRAWGSFAAGDAADQPHPGEPGCRACDPGAVRGADALRRWRGGWRWGRRRARRCVRVRGLPRSRCRLRSGGCGSWTGWRAPARPTRSRWRCGCVVRSTWRRWRRRSASGGAAREPAHDLPGDAGGCAPADPGAGAARPWACGRWGERGRAAAALAAAAGRGFDLASELPLRAHLFALGAQRACAAAGAASHCRRRLVAGAAGARSRALLRGAAWRAGAGACGFAGAICRLHAVAAPVLGWRAMRRARLRASWRSGASGWRVFPEQIELPSDRARPAVASYRGGSVAVRLSGRTARWAFWGLRVRAARACSWCCRRGLRRC